MTCGGSLSQGILSCLYSLVPDVYELINYTAFNESLFVTFCVAGLLWLRYKRPDMVRPIKVSVDALLRD